MAPQQIPGGYGRISHILQLTGDPEPQVVTIGVGGDVGGTAQAQDVVDAYHAAFGLNVMDWVCNVYTLIRTELHYHTALEDWEDPLHVAIADTDYVGLRSESPLPQNSAVLIHKRTGLAGRQYRGRMYVPGINEAGVSPVGALVAGDTRTGWITSVAAYFTAINTLVSPLDDTFPCILHSDPVGLASAPAPTPITSLVVDEIVATQRRRLRR